MFPNPSRSASEGILCAVVIQREPLDALTTRLTLALAELHFAGKVPTVLCPVIAVKGQRAHAKALRNPVDNVALKASALVAAVDAVLSGV